MVWKVLIGVAVGFAVTWLGLVILLIKYRPPEGLIRESLRILPDTLRLVHRLAVDRAIPRGVRLRLGLLLAYLALPFDLIPDFIPGVGYADDVVITALALRAVVRHAGPDSVRAHWPGTPDGLAALWRLARLDATAGRNPADSAGVGDFPLPPIHSGAP